MKFDFEIFYSVIKKLYPVLVITNFSDWKSKLLFKRRELGFLIPALQQPTSVQGFRDRGSTQASQPCLSAVSSVSNQEFKAPWKCFSHESP
jgi:hypothetical protein